MANQACADMVAKLNDAIVCVWNDDIQPRLTDNKYIVTISFYADQKTVDTIFATYTDGYTDGDISLLVTAVDGKFDLEYAYRGTIINPSFAINHEGPNGLHPHPVPTSMVNQDKYDLLYIMQQLITQGTHDPVIMLDAEDAEAVDTTMNDIGFTGDIEEFRERIAEITTGTHYDFGQKTDDPME